MQHIAHVTLLVPTYDEGVGFFVETLGFELAADADLGGGRRWVLVRPTGGKGPALLLAEAANDRQRARIGDQTGGRVGFFLFTDDFQADHRRLLQEGVVFLEKPRREAYGTVAAFLDPFGNSWDLLQPA
jgi:putative peptidoglycan lipid II flippase